jgi:hypothetical protein
MISGTLPALGVENADHGTGSSWRIRHPDRVMNGDLQVLASNGPAWRFHYDAVTGHEATTSASWRLGHPNGPTGGEFQAMSLDAPAWHPSEVAGDPEDPVRSMPRAWAYQTSVTERYSANCTRSLGNYFSIRCPPAAS